MGGRRTRVGGKAARRIGGALLNDIEFISKPEVELLGYNGFPYKFDSDLDPEDVVAYGIRECYDSHGKATETTNAKLVASIASRDESPIEHAVFTFEIVCSRACSHQIVRHRIASYSQRSQRYVKETKARFYAPPGTDTSETESYGYAIRVGFYSYLRLLDAGIKPEVARYVMPNACLTKIVMTINARSLRNFLKLRLNKRAQEEIRQVASQMLDLVMPIAPNIFGDLRSLQNAATD